MTEILEEQNRNECAMYIIYNEIGYIVGEKYQGKGYATKAVSLAIKQGFEKYNLLLIKAGASTENRRSQKVLERNGFKRVG